MHELVIVPHVSTRDVVPARLRVLARTATCDPVLAGRLGLWRRGDSDTPQIALAMLEVGVPANAVANGLDMRTSLAALAARDLDRVETALRELRDERVQADSLTLVMGMRLARAFAPIDPSGP